MILLIEFSRINNKKKIKKFLFPKKCLIILIEVRSIRRIL